MCKSKGYIAVIDSGVGGVSVLKELIKIMPYENYIYLSDSANAPYGGKSMEAVREIVFNNVEFLLKKDIKALVIACNTATGAAAGSLREHYPFIPVIGIEPAVKPASHDRENANVLVMATELTLKQPNFQKLLIKFSDEANIYPLPCPGLMEIVEDGELEGERVDNYLKNLFSSINKNKIDCVVLGCTHYPHIKKAILNAFEGNVSIFDGGEGTAKETKRRLMNEGLLSDVNNKGEVQFIDTADDKEKISLAKRLLNGE